jgi:dsRNA-specific ribonuclease
VVVKVGDTIVGSGKGTSKKKAQEQAAENAIAKIAQWELEIKKI